LSSCSAPSSFWRLRTSSSYRSSSDAYDACPNIPEVFNGIVDDDGCPDGLDGDRDHDGIPDATDKCPDDPEDIDGFMDEDGCPDPDNDGDGILDVDDKCPNVKGPAAKGGCP
jgi:hypothetical protein